MFKLTGSDAMRYSIWRWWITSKAKRSLAAVRFVNPPSRALHPEQCEEEGSL